MQKSVKEIINILKEAIKQIRKGIVSFIKRVKSINIKQIAKIMLKWIRIVITCPLAIVDFVSYYNIYKWLTFIGNRLNGGKDDWVAYNKK